MAEQANSGLADELTTNTRLEANRDLSISELSSKSGEHIKYQRMTETGVSTTGTFSLDGTDVNGYMLEPAGPSTYQSGLNKRIPSGTYNVERYSGTKHKDVFRIWNDKVPKSRAILIHNGSYPRDTFGCLLPGTSISNNFVSGSRPMMNILRNYNIKRLTIFDIP